MLSVLGRALDDQASKYRIAVVGGGDKGVYWKHLELFWRHLI